MANKLFSLFDEKLKHQNDLVATPPQNLESISTVAEEQEFVLKTIRNFEEAVPKVDYSEFSNFVFFNSALDYFNITGEKILNEYPYDGSRDLLQAYLDDLDDYQRFVVDSWPSNAGNLCFNPSSGFAYVQVLDAGSAFGVQNLTLLSPSTGSWTVEFWCVPPPVLTGTNDAMFAVQKVSGSSGYSVYFSGSNVVFRMASGSNFDELVAPVTPGHVSFVACTYDAARTTPIATILTGGLASFPVVVSSVSSSISGPIPLGSVSLFMGSGSLSGKITRPLTGSLDSVRLWTAARSIYDMSGTFNVKQYAQENMIGLWRFNETGSIPSPDNTVVLDSSGHKLNGRIINYYSGVRGSGSLNPFDTADPILSFFAPEVQSFISTQQTSGTLYDKSNDNHIIQLFPDAFFELENERNTQVFQNFLYIIARQLDYIKVRIDQFVNVLRTNYTSYNQAPDALLQDVAKFFGWEFTGNFLSTNAFQYLLGRGVLANIDSNKELEVKLWEIKNEFWRRTLINLMHMYKSKGTRESVESLLRIYGVNQNLIKLKEYGNKPEVSISTERISAEKSVYVLTFGSGSSAASNYVSSPAFSSSAESVEVRIRFPTSATTNVQATVQTGSIWTLNTSGTMAYQLLFEKVDTASLTGTLVLTSSAGQLTMSAPIFDGRWYSLVTNRDPSSGTLSVNVRGVNDDNIISVYLTASVSATFSSATLPYTFWLGATGSYSSQGWMQEARVWSEALSKLEMDDHALNFQSFGQDEITGASQLDLHWRMWENLSASAGGSWSPIYDVSSNIRNGTAAGFTANASSYEKFLLQYNFVAPPDFGWTENKVRSYVTTFVPVPDTVQDSPNVALEFNMVDALNEDISQILSGMDQMNYSLGLPANRFRGTYPDLAQLRYLYFRRLQGRLNFRVFADMIEFFDRSFLDMVRRLLPARVTFLGDEFVVESHMLERPKLQWNYRRQDILFMPSGSIQVYVRS